MKDLVVSSRFSLKKLLENQGFLDDEQQREFIAAMQRPDTLEPPDEEMMVWYEIKDMIRALEQLAEALGDSEGQTAEEIIEELTADGYPAQEILARLKTRVDEDLAKLREQVHERFEREDTEDGKETQ